MRQRGNNNPYSQDNEISWVDWSDTDTALLDFTRRAIAVRRRHPVLRRRRYLTGAEAGEIEWFTPAGAPMTGTDWGDPNARCVTVYLDGSDAPDRDEDGNLLKDDDLLLLVNGWSESIDFVIPATRPEASWTVELDSAEPTPSNSSGALRTEGAVVTVPGYALILMRADAPD